MADKTRVLIVTQEMKPYTNLSLISEVARQLPQHVQEQGAEIRILMPRFGTINERRHRLHEVVRLSGMNIIVDEDDYPLIIKVASLPNTRMQVYFLDNEDFFKRKFIFEDKAGKAFEDNPDRMAFFCKGVVETVKKFGWSPDVVHCLGWMTSLVPAYLRTAYTNEPLFQDSKIVYSAYGNEIAQSFGDDFFDKAAINDLTESDLAAFKGADGILLDSGASAFADAVVLGDEEAAIQNLDEAKPVLQHSEAGEDYCSAYFDFYKELLLEGEEA